MYLTDQIHQQLFYEILEGKYRPGERMPTEMETAERFHASRVTVRRSYAILEKSGIIVRRKRSGTFVSSNYAGATDAITTVAAIIPLKEEFPRDFLKALCAAAARENILTVIEPGTENGIELSNTVIRLVTSGIRNIIIWGTDNFYDAELFGRLRILGVNMVFFDQIRPSGKFADYVGLNNKAAVHAIMDDAAEKGFTNFIYAGVGNSSLDTNRERRESFVSECEKRGFEYSFFEFPWNIVPAPGLLQACRKQMINSGSKTAMVCVNDVVALNALPALPENSVIYSIDGKKEAVARGVISYFQPMNLMAECCLNALKQQCSKGEKWQAEEFLFEGELLGK